MSSNVKCELINWSNFIAILIISNFNLPFSVYDNKTDFDLHDLYGKDNTRAAALNDLENDSFAPKEFTSKSKIVVDLKKDKVIVPEIPLPPAADKEEESLIHPDFIGDEQAKVEKWIKKLYLYRKQCWAGKCVDGIETWVCDKKSFDVFE